MGKKIDLSKPVHDLVKEYPELKNILKNLGFQEITKPAMLNSVGRITTIPKGAKMKGISMMDIVIALKSNGFEMEGEMPSVSVPDDKPKEADKPNEKAESDSTGLLKSYLKRLGAGEDLESVRKDFVDNFSEVDASEIMKAEQDLIREGAPLTEVQKLCDVHSALFHGATREEKIVNAEKAVAASLKKEQEEKKKEAPFPADLFENKQDAAKALVETAGHPLSSWTKENEKIDAGIHEIKKDMEAGIDITDKLTDLRQLAVHYAKKGDLIYPVLKVRYAITGPSDVMWSVDGEIRNELADLDENKNHDKTWNRRVQAVLTRAEEMIYKEANILFPICAVNFTKEEWYEIYRDNKDYAPVFGVEELWEEAESYLSEREAKNESAMKNGEIVLAGGHMTLAQLEAMLNTLPIEISFIDVDNINRYFNEGPKVFKRPKMALDREVFSCHPPKVEPMVRSILSDFRNNRTDSVPVWMEKNGKPFLVTYMAVRDKKGGYLGTVEVVQNMEAAEKHFKGQNESLENL